MWITNLLKWKNEETASTVQQDTVAGLIPRIIDNTIPLHCEHEGHVQNIVEYQPAWVIDTRKFQIPQFPTDIGKEKYLGKFRKGIFF
jgi:hypothetical protein